MPTQLPDFVSEIREGYLRAYRKYLAEGRAHVADLSPEQLALVAEPAGVAEAHRLFRVDAIWRGADGAPAVAHVEAGGVPVDAAGAEVESNGQVVVVHPFVWEDCPVSFSHPDVERVPVVEWLMRRIDRHGQFPADGDGLHGVIHSVSPPETRGSRHYLYVDFGSAPVEAVAELIDVLTGAGSTRVVVGVAGRSA